MTFTNSLCQHLKGKKEENIKMHHTSSICHSKPRLQALYNFAEYV